MNIRVFSVLMAVSVILAALPAAQAASGETYLGSLQIKNETFYEPFPVEPGSYFDFYVVVRNSGKNPVTAECGLRPKYPFFVDSSENNSRVFSELAESREFLLKFRVRVDEQALEGDNNLDFTCSDPSAKTSNTATFKISVRARASTVNIEAISVSPVPLSPGHKGLLVVTVKSASPNNLKDFKIKLELASDALPFVVVNGTNERLVSSVGPYERLDFPFELMSYPSASSGVYKLPIAISYSDKLGKSYSINQSTGLVIASTPVISIAAESSDIVLAGTSGKVLVRVMNRGLSGVKLLQVSLLPSDDYVILSVPTQYIGSVSSDDFETAEFRVYVSPNATGPLALNVGLSYSDSANNAYAKNESAPLSLFERTDALRYGLEKNPDNTLVLVVAAAAALYIVVKYLLPFLRRVAGAALSQRERQARK